MKHIIVNSNEWESNAVQHMNKIAQPLVTLSFKQLLKIEDHAFGTLEIHHNGRTILFSEILANDKYATIKDLQRFQRGKNCFVKQI